MQYDTDIDQQTWAFIRKTERFYSDDLVSPVIEQQRYEYDEMCRAFWTGHPDGISVETLEWDQIPVRIYEPTDPMGTLVYYHGGGFVVGGLESHDDVCAELASETKLRVISVGYRLAPEHKHPAQFNDAFRALQIASSTYPAPLIVCGDSAGGNLAAAVCHHTRSRNIKLAGQILIYPTLGINMDSGSYLTHAHAPMLTLDDMLHYKDIRCEKDTQINDPTFAPLNDIDFTALPATVVFTAACDPLADDGEHYCSAILNAGGKAYCLNETGLVHGYLRARASVDRAKDSFDRIIAAAISLAKGEWPY